MKSHLRSLSKVLRATHNLGCRDIWNLFQKR